MRLQWAVQEAREVGREAGTGDSAAAGSEGAAEEVDLEAAGAEVAGSGAGALGVEG